MKTSQLLSPAFEGGDLTSLDLVISGLSEHDPTNDDCPDQTVTTDDGSMERGNVVDLPRFQPLEYRPTEFFAAIQEWEGAITGVYENHFTANLYDVTAKSDEVSELAEISFEDVDPADRSKVQEGAIFRWLIGHSRTRSGQSSRKWLIYFRRVPKRLAQRSPFVAIGIPEHLRNRLQPHVS